jgi:alkylation response protein AidB-like acyl-CoA dehydrogenase
VLALLTEEQEMLKQTATQLAAIGGLNTPSELATVDRAKAWAALSEADFLALRTRDGEGVPAASGVEVMLVCEAFGAALAPVPYMTGIVAAELMSVAGAPPAWIRELTSGETRYGLLMTRDLSGLARVDDDVGAIAFDTDEAEWALALSDRDGSAALVRVPLGSGFEPAEAADLTRSLARVVGPPGLTVEPVEGLVSRRNLDAWLALALVAVSADVVGVMSSALQRAVEYAKQRVQYGVKIGSFQAIQHLCADALVQVEASASVTRYAAWAVDAVSPEEALLAARVAKAYSSSVAREVTETVMQVYGGIGQTWEHPAHVHTRRALTGRLLFGDESEQFQRIADARLGPAPAGAG